MAARIVLLGPRYDGKIPAFEMTALDGDALRNEGAVQVELAVRDHDGLSDALTLRMTEDYVARRGGGDPVEAWLRLSGFLNHMHGIRDFEIPA